jgi:hypothetical protein
VSAHPEAQRARLEMALIALNLHLGSDSIGDDLEGLRAAGRRQLRVRRAHKLLAAPYFPPPFQGLADDVAQPGHEKGG